MIENKTLNSISAIEQCICEIPYRKNKWYNKTKILSVILNLFAEDLISVGTCRSQILRTSTIYLFEKRNFQSIYKNFKMHFPTFPSCTLKTLLKYKTYTTVHRIKLQLHFRKFWKISELFHQVIDPCVWSQIFLKHLTCSIIKNLFNIMLKDRKNSI